jgi:hypothetical protein
VIAVGIGCGEMKAAAVWGSSGGFSLRVRKFRRNLRSLAIAADL